MKKNRPATVISVIATPDLAEALTAILFAETSTLGLRILQAERRVLARHVVEVETSFGKVRVKYNDNGGFTPEYEDCRKAASDKHVPLRMVIAEANQAFLVAHR
jgi:hypothetical protein